MLILSIHGGLELPHEDLRAFDFGRIPHDAAAVLVKDGRVVAAIEEERLSRIKHTGKFPLHAMEFCLEQLGVTYSDIDRIVLTAREQECDLIVRDEFFYRDSLHKSTRDYLADVIDKQDGTQIDRKKIQFVEHHICHAASAHLMSGFDRSLTVTLDGESREGYAGYIISAEGDQFTVLDRIPNEHSLGAFYISVIRVLGYHPHDEYKVMGMAPYGDPAKFRRYLKKAYTLLPDGKFSINLAWSTALFEFMTPRKKGGPITQEHKDLAAALQEALETIVMHVLNHYRQATGHTKLCLAGGVAHNCSMNGKILYSGLFDEVFVQPAAHDAGNTLGAALLLSQRLDKDKGTETLRHLYWGTEIGSSDDLNDLLHQWDDLIDYEKVDDVAKSTAKLIADGAVIGWVQGRSEFGPRALGNRSILADPRPAENKNIINEMVKKREGYRPFAPSVLEEYVGDYYEMPDTKAPLSFMNFVLRTKEDKQSLLGAVTHVDGTARVQTVSKETNEKYWSLIDEFRQLTGIPVLLNTSFNNNVEPIVDSEEDAIVSFLTTNIHYLVIGDYIIKKKAISKEQYMHMVPERLIGSELKQSIGYTEDGKKQNIHEIRMHFGNKYSKVIPEAVFQMIEESDGHKPLAELVPEKPEISKDTKEIIRDTFIDLWSLRLIKLKPAK
ncbi:beta-1,4-N-acetylglucosamine oligosaccharide 3-O-carbamoyltransferase NolO [Paenibacillus cellulosilyticus]|uniref:Beta-1,4-N-acetylglucosamine oligosaccharide 3-O-carbamoyltransferase NolO n=2 Tax=Paenibacillus cellulosilyticus TaxID=375489 RepID=A0A2V2Z7J4_9BACL|nr:beta-1,4-N-acetylglucosamine oligosaccharide 3-O-carbamoyltransferase NolO [Paenibacillus cellulosilyticus]QKS46454.1 nodulation protein [Paenibacillus cellulosilyticus]